MVNTLKLMKDTLIGNESNYMEEDLIELYKANYAPNILAYFYVKNYPIIYQKSRLYKDLNDEDIASFCLQELDKCLLNFKPGNNKFLTYFLKCFNRRLNNEIYYIYHNCRKTYLYTSELDDNLPAKELNVENLDFILNQYKLTNNEKYTCKLINAGYSLKEIANKLKVSNIYKRNLKIKQKILNYSINLA